MMNLEYRKPGKLKSQHTHGGASWRVEQGLSSVEKRLDARDGRLYETVDELQAKLQTLEPSQERKYEEVKREIHEATEKQLRLRDRDNWLAPSPLKPVPFQVTQDSAGSRTETPQRAKNKGISHADKDEDELWTTLEKIDQLAREKDSRANTLPVPQTTPHPAITKPHIRPTPYDGISSWDDYRAQFELVAELNSWDCRTKAIYLAASLQGPARATLGDLDPTKRSDFSALMEALEARFGSKHQTEIYRAQLRSRTKKREETLPELAQAIQRLTRQAYPNAPSTLRDTLSRDHFIDALPESEVRWRIHQGRPKSLREALTAAVEIEAFYVADRHRARVQARAVLPTSPDTTKPDPLTEEVGELRRAVNKPLAKREQPQPLQPRDGWCRFRSRQLPTNYSGCFSCGGLDHMQRDCPGRGAPMAGNELQSGSRAGARLPLLMQGSQPFNQQ